MALINCPECNNQISDKATNCPHCGYPLAFVKSEKNEDRISSEPEPKNLESMETAPLESEDNSNIREDSADEKEISNNDKNANSFFNKRIKVLNKNIPLVAVFGTALLILIIVVAIILIPKGSSSNEDSSKKPETAQAGAVKPTTDTSVNPNVTPTTSRGSTSGSTIIKKASYLSDRSVQFNEEDNEYLVLFGFKDENGEYVSARGTASIVITDKTGNELYKKDLAFTDSDFSSWSNKLNPVSRLLCGLHIKASDISGAASSSGTLSLAVELDEGASFESTKLSINNLKEKELSIVLPDLPQKLTNYNFKGEVEEVIEVTNIEIETSIHYNGDASAKIHLTVRMLENYSTSTSHYSHVGYKLKDSSGVIVDSGSTGINPMAVGETSKNTFYINNLDANESYTLELENSKR